MNTRTDVQNLTAEQLVNELRALVLEAEKILGDSETEPSNVTLAALHERVEAARQRLADLYAEAKKKVATGVKRTDEAIRDNPYQSLAIALALGVLVGVLVGRRTKGGAC